MIASSLVNETVNHQNCYNMIELTRQQDSTPLHTPDICQNLNETFLEVLVEQVQQSGPIKSQFDIFVRYH